MPLGLTRPLLGSDIGFKYSQGYMWSTLGPLIECYQRTNYLFLFAIGFNTSNIYVLFYFDPMYGNSYVIPKPGNQVGAFV